MEGFSSDRSPTSAVVCNALRVALDIPHLTAHVRHCSRCLLSVLLSRGVSYRNGVGCWTVALVTVRRLCRGFCVGVPTGIMQHKPSASRSAEVERSAVLASCTELGFRPSPRIHKPQPPKRIRYPLPVRQGMVHQDTRLLQIMHLVNKCPYAPCCSERREHRAALPGRLFHLSFI